MSNGKYSVERRWYRERILVYNGELRQKQRVINITKKWDGRSVKIMVCLRKTQSMNGVAEHEKEMNGDYDDI